ncbi:GNAT family N-acetyltransferase [Arenimonas sp.]|uniref:GNAT family N-acetyltransferase n=1 Tax=Arenimonas sp. TaxID=1872635 RepID=UPI0039E5D075
MSRLRLHTGLDEIPATAWDALHDDANPFLRHAFLSGLERHGCLRAHWGWRPRHAALYDGDELIAAAPAYEKTNSHGEFVFDHAWAQAYARAGLDYYPKWLAAVPYSPVTGPRLLARDGASRHALVDAMRARSEDAGESSLHVNFLPEGELDAFDDAWLARGDVQFHWRNPGDWHDFDDFLAALESKKRKNIRQERQRVRRAGIAFRCVHGDEASGTDLAAMHAFYCATQQAYGNHPALTLPFLQHLAETMPRALVLMLAERDGQAIAGALCLRGRGALYGRYWGTTENHPGLHFETCYYQGIDYCLREGLRVFEPGAQGEHKIARGFLPVLTHSRHHVADPRFAEALRPWCAEERESVLRYRDLVLAHSPYRESPPDRLAGP